MTADIRPARMADAPLITEFNRRLAEETEDKTLDSALVTSGVSSLLANPEQGQYYVAERDGEMIGQLLITYEWSDWRNGCFWWIQSVYVAPEHRRSGVFSRLFGHVAELAQRDQGVCGLRLYVAEDNSRAQKTYSTLGLTHAGYRVMEIDFAEGR